MPPMAIPKQFDALIIGGGPAGAAAATLLAQAGWNVAIVEKANYPRRKVCGEFVSATSLPVLRALRVENGDAVVAHVKRSCRGVREALAHALREGDWPAAGPIRPGIRRPLQRGIFLIGNAAGEAHPVIAEGISMAIQSAWLLSRRLIANGLESRLSLETVAEEYERAWRHQFAIRVRAAAIFAYWAMRPALVNCLLPCLWLKPSLLTVCAQWSGKASTLEGKTNDLTGRTERRQHKTAA